MSKTNYTVAFWDDDGEPVAICHTIHFTDACSVAESMDYSSDIIDFHTGEVLRSYKDGECWYEA